VQVSQKCQACGGLAGVTDRDTQTDILVVGGGLGGIAAALSGCRNGCQVILTEETDWLGGQVTAQGVGHLDDHPWIEQFGCTATYRRFRENIRAYYREWYPLVPEARNARYLSPGSGTASALHFEPRVALAVLEAMLRPYESSGRLRILFNHRAIAAAVVADKVAQVTLLNGQTGEHLVVAADYFVDATDTGDLLPLTKTEYVTGTESHTETQEPHAPGIGNPLGMQALTWCPVVDHRPGEDHTISKPAMYEYWSAFRDPEWPNGPLSWTVSNWIDRTPLTYSFDPNPPIDPWSTTVKLSSSTDTVDQELWLFRRMIARKNFNEGLYESDITLLNWGMNDYFAEPVYEVADDVARRNLEAARQLSLSLVFWIQTAAPRSDGGVGFPGLRLRGDVVGTDDGLAKRPYVRESRRIRARYTVVEQDLSATLRGDRGAEQYLDAVGIGSYRLDLHPSCGGGTSMEIPGLPFFIPLGAMLPVRVANLLPGAKNIGTTHITNACYRLHHVEWNVGEVAGLIASFCLNGHRQPEEIHANPTLLEDFQRHLVSQGVEIGWPRVAAY
jgi:FAD dependent oxidoreductase